MRNLSIIAFRPTLTMYSFCLMKTNRHSCGLEIFKRIMSIAGTHLHQKCQCYFIWSSVPLGSFSSKLLSSKGYIWVNKAAEVKTADAHVLKIMMWVNDIISIHWSSASVTKDTTKKGNIKTKKDLHCSFKKKPAGAAIRMNHRDDTCWIQTPNV